MREYRASSGRYGIVSAAYDTELFGHWWFEGVTWLQEVLRNLSRSDVVDLTGAAQFVREHPPRDVVTLPEGSWGQQGTHFTWQNADTESMWPLINGAQRRMEEIVARHGSPSGTIAAAMAQLARELLLARIERLAVPDHDGPGARVRRAALRRARRAVQPARRTRSMPARSTRRSSQTSSSVTSCSRTSSPRTSAPARAWPRRQSGRPRDDATRRCPPRGR